MSTAEIIKHVKQLSEAERLKVLNAVSRLIRSRRRGTKESELLNEQLRKAALAVRDLYLPGGELTEWTCLDAEEFIDEYDPR